jgi:hypothetical protein
MTLKKDHIFKELPIRLFFELVFLWSMIAHENPSFLSMTSFPFINQWDLKMIPLSNNG